MASSNRVFYAVHGIGLKADGVEGNIPVGNEVHGVQSIGLTTSFNLEQIFELGQIDIYENYENKPEIELSIEKVIDDTPLVYHLSTENASAAGLSSRSTEKTTAIIPIYPDNYESASGVAPKYVTCSGMYVSSLDYSFPVDGPATESVTLIGSDKVWADNADVFDYDFINDDEPGTEGVQRREDIIMGSGTTPATALAASRFPTELPGINASGHNLENAGGTSYQAHVQSVSISVNLGREDLFELGRKNEYYKFANFPTEVSTSIEMTETTDGDNIDAYSNQDNLIDQTIMISLNDNTRFFMGDKNKLQDVTRSGGDATGGNSTVSYNYVGYNILTVTNPDNDPAGLAHPSI